MKNQIDFEWPAQLFLLETSSFSHLGGVSKPFLAQLSLGRWGGGRDVKIPLHLKMGIH